jgi:hypothetical protein
MPSSPRFAVGAVASAEDRLGRDRRSSYWYMRPNCLMSYASVAKKEARRACISSLPIVHHDPAAAADRIARMAPHQIPKMRGVLPVLHLGVEDQRGAAWLAISLHLRKKDGGRMAVRRLRTGIGSTMTARRRGPACCTKRVDQRVHARGLRCARSSSAYLGSQRLRAAQGTERTGPGAGGEVRFVDHLRMRGGQRSRACARGNAPFERERHRDGAEVVEDCRPCPPRASWSGYRGDGGPPRPARGDSRRGG